MSLGFHFLGFFIFETHLGLWKISVCGTQIEVIEQRLHLHGAVFEAEGGVAVEVQVVAGCWGYWLLVSQLTKKPFLIR